MARFQAMDAAQKDTFYSRQLWIDENYQVRKDTEFRGSRTFYYHPTALSNIQITLSSVKLQVQMYERRASWKLSLVQVCLQNSLSKQLDNK